MDAPRTSPIRIRRGAPAATIFPLAVLVTLAGLFGSGCRGVGEVSERMVPRTWRDNPWGPRAERARRTGELPSIPKHPGMMAWDLWAREHLQDGDIAFRMGNSRVFFGLLPFSRFSAALSASRYSHAGLIAREGGEVVVYDTTKRGARRQPFSIWILDVTGPIAFKRPTPEHQHRVAGALAYCRDAYARQVPFDDAFRLDDDRLYCAEMVERAYRSAGLPLSKPIRLDQLPRYDEFPKVVTLIRILSPIRPDQRAFVIGNEAIGLLSSPDLVPIHEAPDARPPGVAP